MNWTGGKYYGDLGFAQMFLAALVLAGLYMTFYAPQTFRDAAWDRVETMFSEPAATR